MKIRVLVLLLIVGLAVCGVSSANEPSNGRWSFSAAAGAGHFEIDVNPLADMYDDPEPTSAESRSDAFSLHTSFHVTRHFSIEGSFTDFGSVSYAKKQQCTTPGRICTTEVRPPMTGHFRARAVGLSAIGTLLLAPRFELFGGAGASFVSYQNSFSFGVPSQPGHFASDNTSHKWSPSLRLGANWQFNERWSAQLALTGIRDVSDTTRTGRTNLYSLLLGIACRLGSER